MKNVFFSTLLIVTTLFSMPVHRSSSDIVGRWMSTENNLEVEIFKAGDEFKARVIWFDDKDDLSRPMEKRCDTKNPDQYLKTRKVIGMEVMTGLIYIPENDDWENGQIYDASSGKIWRANVLIMKDGTLKVRGYWHLQCLGKIYFLKKSPKLFI